MDNRTEKAIFLGKLEKLMGDVQKDIITDFDTFAHCCCVMALMDIVTKENATSEDYMALAEIAKVMKC